MVWYKSRSATCGLASSQTPDKTQRSVTLLFKTHFLHVQINPVSCVLRNIKDKPLDEVQFTTTAKASVISHKDGIDVCWIIVCWV